LRLAMRQMRFQSHLHRRIDPKEDWEREQKYEKRMVDTVEVDL